MKYHFKQWDSLNDVPKLTLDWAKLIGGNNISIDDVNQLINEYESYSQITELDDIEQLFPTTD